MRVMVDINILMDILQNRPPHYLDSARLLSILYAGSLTAFIPAHCVTTLWYLIAKSSNRTAALKAMDWALHSFELSDANEVVFRHARTLSMLDFEDAVVASMAQASHCEFVVTRNERDFESSPVPAIHPTALLEVLNKGRI